MLVVGRAIVLTASTQTWSHSPDIIEYLKTMKTLVYGGGPLSRSVGDKLVHAGVSLCNGYGGTEFGGPFRSWDEIPRMDVESRLEWNWFWVKDCVNVRFEPQGDGTYEMIVYSTLR